jgi:hypothetical protein
MRGNYRGNWWRLLTGATSRRVPLQPNGPTKATRKVLHPRLEGDPKSKLLLDRADALDKKLTPVDEELIQANMKGSEANLAFPDMLNELFDSFNSTLEAGDGAPTQQQYEVFKLHNGKA